MGEILERILCPNHNEDTPSCVIYTDGNGYCFGCGSYFPGIGHDKSTVEVKKPKEVENVEETLKYIRNLPITQIRGLPFKYDTEGYYIVWPDPHRYYKCRYWDSSNKIGKYRNPRGVRAPIFSYAADRPTDTTFIVEGEINCLSLRQVSTKFNLICFGGVNQLVKGIEDNKDKLTQKVIVFCDNDDAGQNGSKKAKETLNKCGIMEVRIVLLDKDFNEVLINEGKEGIIKIIQTLGLS